jgi:hypothetical protein
MEKQKFDRIKKILGILVLVFLVVPMTIVSASPYNDDRSLTSTTGGSLHDENLGFPHIIDNDNYACTPYGSFWDAAYTYSLFTGLAAV